MALQVEELETTIELKRCGRCKVEKPIATDFYTSWHKGRNKRYVRPECNDCHRVLNMVSARKWDIKRRLKSKREEIVFRAIVRILKEDEDLLLYVMNKYPTKFKRYLVEEQVKVFYELKAMSIKVAGHKMKSGKESWKILEEDLRTGKLFKM